ncbi:MAG: hypothetical protein M3271_00150 [Actinomycetota bacterium]|nr:hypothetical protein [Actinomycetota bacterium]
MAYLEQAQRPIEVLQSMGAEIRELDIAAECIRGEGARGIGHQNLSAVGRRRDTRRLVNGQPDVTGFVRRGVAGVDAHAGRDAAPSGPRVASERELRIDRTANGIRRIGKNDEERIAFRSELVSVVRSDRRPNYPAIRIERLDVIVA